MPLPFTIPDTLVPKVIAGVVVGFDTVPFNPFAVVTETELTDPEPEFKVDQTGTNGVPVLTW